MLLFTLGDKEKMMHFHWNHFYRRTNYQVRTVPDKKLSCLEVFILHRSTNVIGLCVKKDINII